MSGQLASDIYAPTEVKSTIGASKENRGIVAKPGLVPPLARSLNKRLSEKETFVGLMT